MDTQPPRLPCPLCGVPENPRFFQDRRRDYHRCRRCDLRFVPPHQYPDPATEKAEYDRHRNHPDDPGYRRFLGRLFQPLRQRLPPGSRGLDFGCGPGPTLSVMFAEAGFEMALYDPFYAPDAGALARDYDFITATEVVEHLHRPGQTLGRLWTRLRPGGCLGIMTKLAREPRAFAHWHYIRDPTHVVFFSRESFGWLAARLGATLEIIDPDVILLTRNEP